jgi:hypothetical protein
MTYQGSHVKMSATVDTAAAPLPTPKNGQRKTRHHPNINSDAIEAECSGKKNDPKN